MPIDFPALDSLAIVCIDNGMGLSATLWGYSNLRLGISGVLSGRRVSVSHISYPYPAGAMNIATHEFMKSDLDRLIIIDTDESYEPQHVAWLLSHDVPYVCGLYVKRQPGLVFPMELLDDGGEDGTTPFSPLPLAEGVNPLVEVARCARGFLNVHRSVFDLVRPTCDTYLDAHSGEVHVEYWKGQPGGGSEDYNFCDRYRSLGGKVLVDQRIFVGHHGMCKFPIEGTFETPKAKTVLANTPQLS